MNLLAFGFATARAEQEGLEKAAQFCEEAVYSVFYSVLGSVL